VFSLEKTPRRARRKNLADGGRRAATRTTAAMRARCALAVAAVTSSRRPRRRARVYVAGKPPRRALPSRTFVPADLVTRVLPTCFTENMEGALMLYHSFLRKGSSCFFLLPFLPLDMRLFLPTAILNDVGVVRLYGKRPSTAMAVRLKTQA